MAHSTINMTYHCTFSAQEYHLVLKGLDAIAEGRDVIQDGMTPPAPDDSSMQDARELVTKLREQRKANAASLVRNITGGPR